MDMQTAYVMWKESELFRCRNKKFHFRRDIKFHFVYNFMGIPKNKQKKFFTNYLPDLCTKTDYFE